MLFNMNVYDFDKTIYDGDSTLDFYFFCLKKKPYILFVLPVQFFGFLMYFFKLRDKEYFKEKFYVFLRYINNTQKLVSLFWKNNFSRISGWYLDQKQSSDVIISASPEFLLKPLKEKLGIERIIASKVDLSTGKLLSNNCYGKEKVIRFKKIYPTKKIIGFYTDSKSDQPMAAIAEKSFLVNNKLKEIKKFL